MGFKSIGFDCLQVTGVGPTETGQGDQYLLQSRFPGTTSTDQVKEFFSNRVPR
jgi:hypothetical protein